MPSFAPNTVARSQPMRSVRCRSLWVKDILEVSFWHSVTVIAKSKTRSELFDLAQDKLLWRHLTEGKLPVARQEFIFHFHLTPAASRFTELPHPPAPTHSAES
jgi:hypothetical protein